MKESGEAFSLSVLLSMLYTAKLITPEQFCYTCNYLRDLRMQLTYDALSYKNEDNHEKKLEESKCSIWIGGILQAV